MKKYITCPDCGAHLDYGEQCDCKKSAAPDGANIENGDSVMLSDTVIVSEKPEKVKTYTDEELHNMTRDELANALRAIVLDLTEEERLELLTYGKQLKAAKILAESDFD